MEQAPNEGSAPAGEPEQAESGVKGSEETRECPSCGHKVSAIRRDCPHCGLIVSRFLDDANAPALAAVYAAAPPAPAPIALQPLSDSSRSLIYAACAAVGALVVIGGIGYVQAVRARSALQAAAAATAQAADQPAAIGNRAVPQPQASARPAASSSPFPTWHKVLKLRGASIQSDAAFEIRGDVWRVSYSTRPGGAIGRFVLTIASAEGRAKTTVADTDRAASREVRMNRAGQYTLSINAMQPHLVMVEDYY